MDEKHAPDGTDRDHLVTADEVPDERGGYYHVGINHGERALKLEMNALIERYDGDAESWDDVSGAPLITSLVREARQVEMRLFDNMGVFAEVLPRAEAKRRNAKMIKGRWIDCNKGDSACPDYRSRFVGKEFNVGTDPELSAATPPLKH